MRTCFALLLTLLVSPALAVGGDAASDVFVRCLEKPIEEATLVPMGARIYDDGKNGIHWALPQGFVLGNVVERDQLAVALSRSGALMVVVEKPIPIGSMPLDKAVLGFERAALRDPRVRVLGRKAFSFAGLPAVKLYLEITHGPIKTCASRVFVKRDRWLFRVATLERLLQGRCMGDLVIGRVIDGWKWTAAATLGLAGVETKAEAR